MKQFTITFFVLFILALNFQSKANQSYFLPNSSAKVSFYADSIPVVDSVFEYVEIEAAFTGGDEAWIEYITNNLKAEIPAKRKAPVGMYTVIVQFIVDATGKVSDVKALTSHGFGMENEVMRVLRKSPRWQPAVQYGRKVKAYRKQPVTFAVSEI